MALNITAISEVSVPPFWGKNELVQAILGFLSCLVSLSWGKKTIIILPASTPLTHDTGNCRGLGTLCLVT